METKNFYRIIYQSNLNYSDEEFKTLQEALDRCEERKNHLGKIYKVTEVCEPVNF